MDGIHDLGGVDGFGSVPAIGEDATFHDQWEGRAHAMLVALLARGVFNTDEFRHARERVDPDYYLQIPYYELVLAGIEKLLLEEGVVDVDELEQRVTEQATDRREPAIRSDPEFVADVRQFVDETGSREMAERDPTFEAGDRVVVRNDHPLGHTRAPRYARRATGVVQQHFGTYRFPDASAHGESAAHPVYNVRFDATELWGDRGDEADAVRLDLWEPYLDPADG